MGPAALGEPALGVLVGTAGRLHDTVQAHELADHDAHGVLFSRTVTGLRRGRPPRRPELIASIHLPHRDVAHTDVPPVRQGVGEA